MPESREAAPKLPPAVAQFVEQIKELVAKLPYQEANHYLHLPTDSALQKQSIFVGAWTVEWQGMSYALRLDIQARAGDSTVRGCCLVERLRSGHSKSSNTPDVTLTSETTSDSDLVVRPKLTHSEWRAVEAELVRVNSPATVSDRRILVGRLSEPALLETLLTVTGIVSDARR